MSVTPALVSRSPTTISRWRSGDHARVAIAEPQPVGRRNLSASRRVRRCSRSGRSPARWSARSTATASAARPSAYGWCARRCRNPGRTRAAGSGRSAPAGSGLRRRRPGAPKRRQPPSPRSASLRNLRRSGPFPGRRSIFGIAVSINGACAVHLAAAAGDIVTISDEKTKPRPGGGRGKSSPPERAIRGGKGSGRSRSARADAATC